MNQRSLAQVYALIVGAALLVAGVAGFFSSADFSVGAVTRRPEGRGELIGLLAVNGWHNVVHLASGLVGLALARSYDGGRVFALGFGGVYVLLGLMGLALGGDSSLLGVVALNDADNVFHLLVGLAGIVAGSAPPDAPEPTTV